MSTLRLVQVIVKAKVGKKAHYVAVAGSVSAAYLAHAGSYPGCPVDPNVFKAQVATLTAWQAQAREPVPGAAAAPGAAAQRDLALVVVAASVELIRAFVEALCNASPEQAATLAQGAALHLATY